MKAIETLSKEIVVPRVFQCRRTAAFCNIVQGSASWVTVEYETRRANMWGWLAPAQKEERERQSALGQSNAYAQLMGLGVPEGGVIQVTVTGPDAEWVMADLVWLVEQRPFEEYTGQSEARAIASGVRDDAPGWIEWDAAAKRYRNILSGELLPQVQ